MFAAIGRFSYHFRWVVIGVWIVLFAVSVIATPFLEQVLTGGFSNPKAPSQQAARLIQEKFQQGPTQVLAVFKSDSLQATSDAFVSAEQKALDGLLAANIPGLLSVQTYANTGGGTQLVSKDGLSSVAVLNFSASSQQVQSEIDQIRGALVSPTLKTYLTGEPAIFSEVSSYSFRDLRKVEIYGLPVALIALLFVFGSLVAAALPVITGGLAVTVTLGAMYLIGRATSMSIFSMNIATLLGLAVAIDYALFIVNRFREELHRDASVRDAVIVTTARAGRSVFFSGAAVLVGVVGLIFFPSPGIRSLGIGGAIVVFFSVAASLTFMPALLAVLGHKVNSIPVVRLHEAHNGRRWKWWSGVLQRRPWAAILAAIVLGSALAIPATWMHSQMTTSKTLPPAAESRQGIEILDTEFDREALSPISVLLTWGGDGKVDVNRAFALFTYGQQLLTTPGVTSVLSPFTLQGLSDPSALVSFWPQFEQLLNDPDQFNVPPEGLTFDGQTISAAELNQFKMLVKGSVASGGVLFRVVSADPPDSSATYKLVDELVGQTPPSGYQSFVAGEAAYSHDFLGELNFWLPYVVIWIVFTSLIVFAVLLRSVVLPILAVVVNLFTIAMSYGILVLLFQGGSMERILGFTSTGGIDAINRVVMLCVLFGITMDYAVFMLTRMHERWLRVGENRESVGIGVIRTGRIIVSAALLVVIVTGAFAFTNIATTKMLGLGIALAIIADTVLVRLMLLPAVMIYIGKASWWWPSFTWFRPKSDAPDARPRELSGDED